MFSRQIPRVFYVHTSTEPMHGNANTPHMIRKQYNPTGQVTFFCNMHQKNASNISAALVQTTKNWRRTIKQRAIHRNTQNRNTQGRPRHHTVPGPPPHFYVSFYVSRLRFTPAKSGPGIPSTTGPPPHPAEAAHAQGPAPPLRPHREKPSQ